MTHKREIVWVAIVRQSGDLGPLLTTLCHEDPRKLLDFVRVHWLQDDLDARARRLCAIWLEIERAPAHRLVIRSHRLDRHVEIRAALRVL